MADISLLRQINMTAIDIMKKTENAFCTSRTSCKLQLLCFPVYKLTLGYRDPIF